MPALARAKRNPYGSEHQKRRKALLPAAQGTPCPARYSPNCDGIMTVPSRMHLDHSTPLALGGVHGDRIICAPCNLSSGAALGNRLRAARRRATTRRLPRW
ncbi:MAG TPA: hypothetical protein VFH56_01540 [Acidimicrobiales bacterium]|nr:hypothetical protein [Acidimicrobiales bacterium]